MFFLKGYKVTTIFLTGILLFLLVWTNAYAANTGDILNFNVEKDFDASARTSVSATLVKTTNNLYFYIEKPWWDSQPQLKQNEILANLGSLSEEFDNKIYPNLTSIFGSEWKSGVDGDNKITILFESMNSSEGGYFRTADEYIKLQLPASNEREMVYLALDRIDDPRLKVFLAHEFVHLITFNQKDKIFKVEEEVWLNEARADYSSTILGYDDIYSGSNLQQRVKDFIESPSDSITEWKGTKYDYASVSLFMHYILDHYGINILIDSLKSKYVGIESINYALQKNGFKENFSQIAGRVLDKQLRNTIKALEATPGIMIAAGEDNTRLRDALNSNAKIITTTIQKFPFVQDVVVKLSAKKFALIVDEAHSSQSGEMRRTVQETLGDYDEEEWLLRQMAARQQPKNISYFAFTATLPVYNRDKCLSSCPNNPASTGRYCRI